MIGRTKFWHLDHVSKWGLLKKGSNVFKFVITNIQISHFEMNHGVDTLAIHVEMALQRFKVLLSGEVSDDEQSTYRITYLHASKMSL